MKGSGLLSRLVLVSLLAPLAATAGEDESFATRALAMVELGEPLTTDQVVLFPLVAKVEPGGGSVVAARAAAKVVFAEPGKAKRKYDVAIRNDGDAPVLVVGGTVLEGGTIDRLIRRDSILAPGGAAEVRALPAASLLDTRKEAAPFQVASAMAPLYLRRQAEMNASESLVPTFVARWADFRNEGDERRSLAAIAESKKIEEFAIRSREQAATFPEALADAKVVGGIAAIRGRIQGFVLYGSNDLLRSYFTALVEGATYASAAIELRAKAAGVPIPGRDDPQKTLEIVRKEAAQLLVDARNAKTKPDPLEEGEAGEAVVLDLGARTLGRAVGLDGKLVHLVIYPYDPVEGRLYAAAVDPDKKPAPESAGGGKADEGGNEDVKGGRPPSRDEIRFINRLRGTAGGVARGGMR